MDPYIQYLSTAEAYDRWAAVYDTDGNFLQALDTLEMKKLLPCLLTLLETSNLPRPWKLVDLGCGTGRNTAALLKVERAAVVGLDVSTGMLQVARNRLGESGLDGSVTLEVFDLLGQAGPPESAKAADAVVSTLVLENIPTEIFFQHVAQILKPGGLLLLTNMHSEMGKLSQAGFTDPQTGKKIRPTSYAHTLAEVEETATKHGFEMVGQFEERAVDASMVPILGERSRKWVGVTVWFGGILQKRH
ncbi:putative methyltransferase AN0656 [Exophiala dermatitidis]